MKGQQAGHAGDMPDTHWKSVPRRWRIPTFWLFVAAMTIAAFTNFADVHGPGFGIVILVCLAGSALAGLVGYGLTARRERLASAQAGRQQRERLINGE